MPLPSNEFATGGPTSITLRGPLFSKNIPKVLRAAILKEAMEKFEKRVRRPKKSGHNLGRKRNPIPKGVVTLRDGVEMALRSTTGSHMRNPRTTGKAWVSANMAAIKKMVPFVIRKAARKMAAELN